MPCLCDCKKQQDDHDVFLEDGTKVNAKFQGGAIAESTADTRDRELSEQEGLRIEVPDIVTIQKTNFQKRQGCSTQNYHKINNIAWNNPATFFILKN